MKKQTIKPITVLMLLAGSILFANCTSTTMIQSNPSGARVYIDGQSVGITPYLHTDTKIAGSMTTLRLEKEGYGIFNTTFSRTEQVDVGAVIGGLIAWIPFLWTMKYNPSHTYELTQIPDYNQTTITTQSHQNQTKSKVDRLREFKQLLDEKIITQEEFEKEKKKILEEDEK